jgi:hypothetical protein
MLKVLDREGANTERKEAQRCKFWCSVEVVNYSEVCYNINAYMAP